MALSIEEINTIIIFVLLGAIGWEFVVHLPFDCLFVHRLYKHQVSVLAVVQYMCCKISMLIFATLAALIQVRNDSIEDCFILVNSANYAGGFSIWFASSVFVLRAVALEGGIKRPLSIMLAVVALGNGHFLFTRFQPRHLLDDYEVPTLANSWSCHHSGLARYYAAWPWTTFAVDLIGFLIMLRALLGQVGKPAVDSGFGHVLVRDGLIYLLLTGSLSLAAGISAVIYNEGKADNPLAVGLPVLLCSAGGAVIATCSIRRLFYAREKLRAPHDFFDLERTGTKFRRAQKEVDLRLCNSSTASPIASSTGLALVVANSRVSRHYTWPRAALSNSSATIHINEIVQLPVALPRETAETGSGASAETEQVSGNCLLEERGAQAAHLNSLKSH